MTVCELFALGGDLKASLILIRFYCLNQSLQTQVRWLVADARSVKQVSAIFDKTGRQNSGVVELLYITSPTGDLRFRKPNQKFEYPSLKSNFTEDFFNKCIIVVRHSTSNWGVDTRKKRMRLVRAIALTIPVDMYYGCTSFSWSDHPQNAAALLIWGLTTWTKVIRHLHFKKHPPQRNWHCGDINSILRRRTDADLSLTQKNHFISKTFDL